jgi:hypothetical protein
MFISITSGKVRNITDTLTSSSLAENSSHQLYPKSFTFEFVCSVSGSFMDATGSYDASFYLSGSLILVSAILCYPLKRLNTWEMQKSGKMAPADI